MHKPYKSWWRKCNICANSLDRRRRCFFFAHTISTAVCSSVTFAHCIFSSYGPLASTPIKLSQSRLLSPIPLRYERAFIFVATTLLPFFLRQLASNCPMTFWVWFVCSLVTLRTRVGDIEKFGHRSERKEIVCATKARGAGQHIILRENNPFNARKAEQQAILRENRSFNARNARKAGQHIISRENKPYMQQKPKRWGSTERQQLPASKTCTTAEREWTQIKSQTVLVTYKRQIGEKVCLHYTLDINSANAKKKTSKRAGSSETFLQFSSWLSRCKRKAWEMTRQTCCSINAPL